MAKKKPAPKRGRQKGEQQHIPGVGPEKNKRVHPLAVDYVRKRDHRMELTKEEKAAQILLIDAMHDEGLQIYEYGDVSVELQSKGEKVKVRIAGVESTDEE